MRPELCRQKQHFIPHQLFCCLKVKAYEEPLWWWLRRVMDPERQSVDTTGCPCSSPRTWGLIKSYFHLGWCPEQNVEDRIVPQFDLQFQQTVKSFVCGISQTLKKGFLENKVERILYHRLKKNQVWKQLQKFRDIQKGFSRKTGSVRE